MHYHFPRLIVVGEGHLQCPTFFPSLHSHAKVALAGRILQGDREPSWPVLGRSLWESLSDPTCSPYFSVSRCIGGPQGHPKGLYFRLHREGVEDLLCTQEGHVQTVLWPGSWVPIPSQAQAQKLCPVSKTLLRPALPVASLHPELQSGEASWDGCSGHSPGVATGVICSTILSLLLPLNPSNTIRVQNATSPRGEHAHGGFWTANYLLNK